MVQPTLENERVRLTPLSLENFALLSEIAYQPGLVRYSPGNLEDPWGFRSYVERALEARDRNEAIPFLIYDKKVSAYAGSTRYMHIDWKNKVLHIGATWIGREFHGTGLNRAMKNLLLDYAFIDMDFEKVEFRIDERNLVSRKAVEKLGAKLEGILRRNVYLEDGYKRNTCCYGLLRNEWQSIKSSP